MYSGLEEAKADVVGMFGLQWLMDHGALPKDRAEEYYASYVAGIFRTLRFGTGEAHGRAEMMEFNYLLEKRALSHRRRALHHRLRAHAPVAGATRQEAADEASGDRARAEAWFAKYDKMPADGEGAGGHERYPRGCRPDLLRSKTTCGNVFPAPPVVETTTRAGIDRTVAGISAS